MNNSSLPVLLKQRRLPPLVLRLLLILLFLAYSLTAVMSLSTASSSSAAAASTSSPRKFDLIIYGATGFTGQLAAAYVHKHYHATGLKYALAGRNLSKLQEVRHKILCGGGGADDDAAVEQDEVPLIVADAVQNPESLDDLAASTRVIANYAGTPFIDKALPVVQACVKHGTCYTDITGEVPFQRASYDRYHQDAKKSGALIIHACGYDSIPSDLGALLAANAMRERHGCDCESIELVAGDTKGGASGGTIHTGMELLFGNNKDLPGVKEAKARGAYALDPDDDTSMPGSLGGANKRDTCDSVSFVSYDPISKRHVIPFIMAGTNAPVVRKSNALFGYRYGKNCSYREVQAVSNWWTGLGSMLGFGLVGAVLMFPPTRWLVLKYVLPQPGQGPSPEQQETGYFTSHIYAVGETTDTVQPIVEAYVKSGNAGDPGYKATARMSIEASLCMALQRDACASKEGGVLTPAFGLGMTLVDRLNKSGMELGVVSP